MNAETNHFLTQSLQEILENVFDHHKPSRALLVYDDDSPLATCLARAYQKVLPDEIHLNFSENSKEFILETINLLKPGDLVILVQSSSFRLDAFRIRVHLFEKQLKVIEHPHLSRIRPYEQEIYIDSLAYEAGYYRHLGPALKNLFDQAGEVKLHAGDHVLVYEGPFESAKLNIGDYRQLKNKGGQFPIGEVFTELQDLTHLNGTLVLFAFGDRQFSVYNCKSPILVKIEKGRITDTRNSVPAFDEVLNDIRHYEGEIWVRELGLGLNRAMTRSRQIRHDIGTYERMCGIHLSLGGKHTVYPKNGFHKKKVKYHVDVFAITDQVTVDGRVIYENEKYTL